VIVYACAAVIAFFVGSIGLALAIVGISNLAGDDSGERSSKPPAAAAQTATRPSSVAPRSPSPSPSLPFEVTGDKPFEVVAERVVAANPDAAWLKHITRVGPAGRSLFDVFDLQIDTDLDEASASDTALGVEICKAFELASAPDTGIVLNGLEYPITEPKVQVDGSLSERIVGEPRSSKLVANNLGEDPVNCSKA
jgi:hypothetical protein